MKSMHTVGIAGAGIMGRLLAFFLLKKGWQVTLFDEDDQEGKASCSHVAAGMLAPFAELEMTEPLIFELGMASLTLWEDLLPELCPSVYFQRTGSLLLSHAQDLSELTRLYERIHSRLHLKSRDDTAIQMLHATDITELEPGLAHWKNEGLYLPSEGQIDTRMLLHALRTALLEQGASWKTETPVRDLKPGAIFTDSSEHRFDWVCDCRGLGAQKNWPDLRGVRGEIIRLEAKDVQITRPVRLIHPRYRLYIVPRPNHRYIIGASEIESEDLSPISVRTVLELLSAAFSVHPGFAEARILETTTHCRPAFSDNLPKFFYRNGLLAINGLYRHGYLLAPILAEMGSALLEKGVAAIRYPQLLERVPHDQYYVEW